MRGYLNAISVSCNSDEASGILDLGLKNMRPRRIFGAMALLLVSYGVAHAETLSGTVLDPQEQGIANADVSLKCPGQTETQKTDSEGRFAFTSGSLL